MSRGAGRAGVDPSVTQFDCSVDADAGAPTDVKGLTDAIHSGSFIRFRGFVSVGRAMACVVSRCDIYLANRDKFFVGLKASFGRQSADSSGKANISVQSCLQRKSWRARATFVRHRS